MTAIAFSSPPIESDRIAEPARSSSNGASATQARDDAGAGSGFETVYRDASGQGAAEQDAAGREEAAPGAAPSTKGTSNGGAASEAAARRSADANESSKPQEATIDDRSAPEHPLFAASGGVGGAASGVEATAAPSMVGPLEPNSDAAAEGEAASLHLRGTIEASETSPAAATAQSTAATQRRSVGGADVESVEAPLSNAPAQGTAPASATVAPAAPLEPDAKRDGDPRRAEATDASTQTPTIAATAAEPSRATEAIQARSAVVSTREFAAETPSNPVAAGASTAAGAAAVDAEAVERPAPREPIGVDEPRPAAAVASAAPVDAQDSAVMAVVAEGEAARGADPVERGGRATAAHADRAVASTTPLASRPTAAAAPDAVAMVAEPGGGGQFMDDALIGVAGGSTPGSVSGSLDGANQALGAATTVAAAPATSASAGAAAAAASHAPPPAAAQIAAAIVAQPGEQRIELRLDPPELGRIEIDLTFERDGLKVVLRAERDDALDLMRRQADALTRELEEAGLDLADLSFAADDGSAFGRDQNDDATDAETSFAAASVAVENVAGGLQVGVAAPGGLDLRL